MPEDAAPPGHDGLRARLVALAEADPDRHVVVDQTGAALDRAGLVAAADRASIVLADAMARSDRPDGRMGVFLPNRVSWLIAQVAADRLGLPVVGLNTRFREAELDHLCRVAEIGAVVVADGFLGIDASSLFGSLTAAPVVVDEAELTATPSSESADEVATSSTGARRSYECIGYTTSGTTGFPKVAMHDLDGTLHHLDAAASASGHAETTVALVALPLCGTFGWVSAFAPILAGGRVVLHETWDPTAAAAAIDTHGVTTFNGADTMQAALVDALEATGTALTTTLTEGVFADFANAGVEVAERAERSTEDRYRLSGVYGSSEGFALMSRWADDDPADLRRRNGGRLVSPEMAVRAVDPSDGRVLDDGEPGELHFRGPNLLSGYAGNPEATAAAFVDGWFRSGDLGTTLGPGAFEYRARLGDSLRLRGFLCDPSEIEHHLERHPDVELAQVVGVTVEGEGDVAVAFVRAPGDVTPSELVGWCRDGLANYKCPTRIELVEEFPVTEGPNGVKIRKVDLRDRAAELLAESEGGTP